MDTKSDWDLRQKNDEAPNENVNDSIDKESDREDTAVVATTGSQGDTNMNTENHGQERPDTPEPSVDSLPSKNFGDTAAAFPEIVPTNDMDAKSSIVSKDADDELETFENTLSHAKNPSDDIKDDVSASDVGNGGSVSVPSPKPTRTISNPPKRGRTAYFIFMSENRSKVQAENEGKSVGAIAKIMGQLWKDLDPNVKQIYMDKSQKEKQQYVEDQKLYLEQHPEENVKRSLAMNADGSQKAKDPLSLTYPLARIRKIARLDPEVKGISKEATLAITKAAELFTERFGNETNSMAQMQKRQKILNQDLVDVVSLKEPFFFLKEDLLDLIKLQQKQKREGETGDGSNGKGKKSSVLSEKAAKAASNTKPLTSFFKMK